jgi:putative spermidine/putrescine transport system permease protein
MQASAARWLNAGWVLVAPFLLIVVALYLGPILDILRVSFTDPQPGFQNYARLWESDSLVRILWTTFRVCAVTTVLAVGLGYLVAYTITHAAPGERKLMLTVILLSFWISVLVRTFAWIMLLGHNGVVNTWLMALGLVSQPLPLMRNETGVIIGMVQYMIPYAVLPLLANMQGLDQRVMNASRSLGAGRWQTFRRIYLPLTLPGIVAASVLVFIVSLGFYVTPAILGGGKVLMMAEYISVQVLITTRWGLAAMLATVMLASVLALLFVLNRFMPLGKAMGGSR